MATINIYDTTAKTTKSVTVDFVMENTAPSYNTIQNVFYFNFSSGAQGINNITLPRKIVTSLTDLVLNGAKQRRTDTAAAYTDIKDMVLDYAYDYINGHTADLYSSGCTAQSAMKF